MVVVVTGGVVVVSVVLLRCNHFDTPGGVGLRNLTRTGYRKLLGIDNDNEHINSIVILFCSYDICRS